MSATMPLTWTNSPPTVPGWYWWGHVDFKDYAVRLYDRNMIDSLPEDIGGSGFRWSGPIPEPQEPPSGTQK